jgi:ABC-type sugar transport system ATPase subunit
MEAGIAFVPEDRQQQGWLWSCRLRNATTVLGRLQTIRPISQEKESAIASEWTSRMRLKDTSRAGEYLRRKSTKVVLAKAGVSPNC